MPRTIHGLPGVYNSSALSLSDGEGCGLACNSQGELIVNLGTDTDGLVKDEDTAHTTGDSGIMMLAVRDDSLAGLADTDGDYTPFVVDSLNHLWMREGYRPGYEDNTNNKAIVEHRYTYQAVITSDTQVKASAGLLHSVTVSCNDAAPTAGSIIIYDNMAESGTQVFNHTFTTTPFVPFSVILDYVMTTGIYVGFTTTADVNVSLSYR